MIRQSFCTVSSTFLTIFCAVNIFFQCENAIIQNVNEIYNYITNYKKLHLWGGGKSKFIHLCTTLRVLAQKCPKRKAHKLSATKCEHSLWSTGHTTHLWLADRSKTNLWVLLSSPMKPVSDPKKPNLFFETEVKCNLDQNFN